MIQISKYIEPDISAVIERTDSYKDDHYELVSVVFEEGLVVINECSAEGEVSSYNYRNSKYYGMRMKGDIIQVCVPKHGYIPIYEQIQDKYNEQLAEKVLLDGSI